MKFCIFLAKNNFAKGSKTDEEFRVQKKYVREKIRFFLKGLLQIVRTVTFLIHFIKKRKIFLINLAWLEKTCLNEKKSSFVCINFLIFVEYDIFELLKFRS